MPKSNFLIAYPPFPLLASYQMIQRNKRKKPDWLVESVDKSKGNVFMLKRIQVFKHLPMNPGIPTLLAYQFRRRKNMSPGSRHSLTSERISGVTKYSCLNDTFASPMTFAILIWKGSQLSMVVVSSVSRALSRFSLTCCAPYMDL